MARHVLSLQDLGDSGSWLLVQQARGIPDARSHTDFMTERMAMLLFAQESLPERLCITAAVRQMGGSTLYQGTTGEWREELDQHQHQLMGVINYYVDCMYLYGFPARVWETREVEVEFSVINAGSPDGHPAHALADIACMLKYSKDKLMGVRIGWIGCTNGTLFSLIEGAAARYGVTVDIAETPEEAAAGVNYLFAGCRSELDIHDEPHWRITEKLMEKAAPEAHVLLGSQPIRAIGVEKGLALSPRSLLLLQAENRLRVHKRLLHWVFLEG